MAFFVPRPVEPDSILVRRCPTWARRVSVQPRLVAAFFRALGRNDARELTGERFGPEFAAVFYTQIQILEDAGFLRSLEEQVEDRGDAFAAVTGVLASYRETFERIENPYFRERGADIVDVGRRIVGMQVVTRESVEALARIGERIREVEMTATAIAQAVDEQSLSSRELAHNLDLAANGVDAVGSNLAQIGDMARGTGAAAAQVLTSADQLDGTARALDTSSRGFVHSVRAA